MSLRGLPPADIFDKALGGERRALGRLITFVERDAAEAETVAELAHERAGNAHVIGITGAPGSGKSTLTGQLVKLLGEAGKRAAVLAVDPSSPLTGGAILGDRVRMEDVASPDTFIRSMATRGHQGGLSLAVPGVVRLLDATGYDPIVIETVGVGQVEVDIAGTADTTVVVATPGMGDSVQANKAGLLELADLFVVNKADRPGAKDVRRDLDLMLDLSHVSGQDQRTGMRPEIIMTTALSGEGAPEMWDAIERHRTAITANGQLEARRVNRDIDEVRNRLMADLESRVDLMLAGQSLAGVAEVLDAVAARSLSPTAAATQLAARIKDL
ncbi:MAG: methylmalonyl Co-A mutase-associated GTPase MeaB [Acidimicrobiaceae bacterium]|nr:methylmalonyl Co-A mutase-associated GTPase MeaB [Acidimicrobiaceae bacterium]MCO4832952.1 methylmalonyl Co-A mutase-associated GTPase MeaB [Acidimicrobiaceae bacterium]MDA9241606.1 methylmalonyl Co-A mutase-associated GTPase MeaB [bacterium]